MDQGKDILGGGGYNSWISFVGRFRKFFRKFFLAGFPQVADTIQVEGSSLGLFPGAAFAEKSLRTITDGVVHAMEDPERSPSARAALVQGLGEGFFSRSLFSLQQDRSFILGPLGHIFENHAEGLVPARYLSGVLGKRRAFRESRDVPHDFHRVINFSIGPIKGKNGNFKVPVRSADGERAIAGQGLALLKNLPHVAEKTLFLKPIESLVAGTPSQFV